MEEENKTLLLFTGEFPYGKRGEPFLEDEIIYLSENFGTIYIFPRQKRLVMRNLPGNTEVVDVLAFSAIKILCQSPILLIKGVIAIIVEFLRTKHGYKYLLNPKHFLYVWLEANELAHVLTDWLKKNNISNSVNYSYWSDSALLACSLMRKKGTLNQIVTRVHGFDLYNERNLGGLIPFRNTMYKYVDKIYCISKHGQRYLEQKLPCNLHHKLSLSYLGVNPTKINNFKNASETPIIVSCARMEVFKRISMMPDVLTKVQTPIHWVHFGDGPEFDEVSEKIKLLPSNIKVTLMGQCKNSEILEFYASNSIRLFLSLSLSEGLPVSMMEAISFGIPILSTAINGTPEIVTPETGVLVSISDSVEIIAEEIEHILKDNSFNQEKIKTFFFNNFNAENNYSKFAKEIAK